MFARVVSITDPNPAFFQTVVLPRLRALNGFCEAMLLTSDDNSSALVVSLWESGENLHDGQATPVPHHADASGPHPGPENVRDVGIYQVALRS